MTISAIPTIIRRIKYAKPDSRISVFVEKEDGRKVLNAVFHRTVETQQKLRGAAKGYVGTFYCGSNIGVTRELLHSAIGARR